ncbi:anti-sigma factor family protein [Bacillus sp. DJP31]|uniref:anti-sigma factor family protein n=1 Tax=Bacillus sp. DJP31 TaxID=3409789 RepID=UPI003BB5B256
MKHLSDDLLVSYQLDELKGVDRIEVENHLEDCSVCQNQFEELLILDSVWDEPSFEPSVDFTDHREND